MSIGPIIPGRIPAQLLARQLSSNVQRNMALLSRLQDQLATGQRFFLPGEAPAAAVRSIVLQKTLERSTQLEVNIQTDRSLLGVTENVLNDVASGLNRAKALLLAGVGDSSAPVDRQALAVEAESILKGLLNAANSTFRGRFLFGGSETGRPPFEMLNDGTVRYNGDALAIDSFVDFGFLMSNNVDGQTAFGALSEAVVSGDLNPALALESKLSGLHRGDGVSLGQIVVTLDDGATTQTQTIDLSSAETIGDVKTLIENAFAAGPLTLSVDVDPGTNNGLALTPSAGTVSVADVPGGHTAADLGIASSASATISGGDLDPRMTLLTPLAALNGGTGIGPTAGTGLVITNGTVTRTIDIDSAVTVEDLFNRMRSANLNVDTQINDAGDGLAIRSRLSGASLSIGENGGQNATLLGIRTLTAGAPLSELNVGLGVPVNELDQNGNPLPAEIHIVRRDGTAVAIDLAGAATVQDVLDRINAVDPGVLTASLAAVGNGINLVDNDGVSTGPLIVEDNRVAQALGLVGQEPGTDPTVPLVGSDVNPQQGTGAFSILVNLVNALRNSDDRELTRLDGLINRENDRLSVVRAELGTRLRLLDEVENRLLDQQVNLQESLSLDFDTDFTEAVMQVTQVQTTLQAVLQIAAQTSQLTLLSFL